MLCAFTIIKTAFYIGNEEMRCIARLTFDHRGGRVQLLQKYSFSSGKMTPDWQEKEGTFSAKQWTSLFEKVIKAWPDGRPPNIISRVPLEDVWGSIICVAELHEDQSFHLSLSNADFEGPDADLVTDMFRAIDGIVASAFAPQHPPMRLSHDPWSVEDAERFRDVEM